jgi:predicted dehydrogenase
MAGSISPPSASAPRKIRYAVVGLGHIAQVAVLPAFKHAAENSELVALVSSDSAKLEKLATKYGIDGEYSYDEYDECLHSGEIDAVYITLPNHLHRSYAVRAAEAGVHVLCEKPLAPTESDCEAMISAADRHGVKLMTAYRLHFEEATLSTIELVQSGKIGEPRTFSSVFTMNVADPKNIRLSSPEKGGGTVYDIGIYCINAARSLFRSEPTEVFAVSANNGEPRFQHCDEMTSAILRFPGERTATFTTSFGATDVSHYRIVGTEGWALLEPGYEYAEPLRRTVVIGEERTEREFEKRDQFAPELVHFSNCILNDEQPKPSGWEGLADVRIVRAVYQSAASGRPVSLAPLPQQPHPSLAQEMHKPPVAKKPAEVNARGPSQR